jgi:hypothetical protein
VVARDININVGESHTNPHTLIFISSLFPKLEQEKKSLEEEIRKLQDIFAGIDYISSSINNSVEEHLRKIKEADLYIGLFSDEFSPIDEQGRKSFIELEYETTVINKLPYLFYFKTSILSSDSQKQEREINPRYEALKAKLLGCPDIYIFKDIYDLQKKFLVDFIKLLHGPLFEKVTLSQYNHRISFDSLHSLCKGTIKEQIKTVGQDKYLPEIYIEREAEKEIESFIQFEKTFLDRTDTILDELREIAQLHSLGMTDFSYLKAKETIKSVHVLQEYMQVINVLKQVFHYEKTETLLKMIYSSIRISNYNQFSIKAKEILAYLRSFIVIDERNLAEFEKILFELNRTTLTSGNIPDPGNTNILEMKKILPSRIKPPSSGDPGVYLANDLIKELIRLVELQSQRCIALVTKAGYGKTNIICRIAERLIEEHPVILLSGQIEITSEYDIEFHIQRQLETEFRGIFSDWMKRLNPDPKTHKWLYILIDGINENNNLPLLVRLLKNFLLKIQDKRIRLILSCRDVFWDLFSETVNQYIFGGKIIGLTEFTTNEREQAVQLYFHQFNIRCQLDKNAEVALRNPLLLRFFCEVYRDQELINISEIKLLSVFDLYLERISQNISERFAFLRSALIIEFLIKISNKMWAEKRTSVYFEDIGITGDESSKPTSIYSLLRSENIIFDETQHFYSTQSTVRFLYDEFMEYMVARSWVDFLVRSKLSITDLDALLQEAVAAIGNFSPAFGAILFLDKMLNYDGVLINKAIVLMASIGDEFIASQQIKMLNAFENININSVDNDLIITLEKFEKDARDEIKVGLAPVIIRVLEQQPDHPIMKVLVSRLLEVDHKTTVSGDIQKMSPEGSTKFDSVEKTSSSDTKEKHLKKGGWWGACQETYQETLKNLKTLENTVLEDLKTLANTNDKPLGLPPGRYHYSEEAKLNAISILVASKNIKDYELVEQGIRNLGKMELHSALYALTSLDLASDELVYKMISKYLDVQHLPEYKIYCAWLLRERYGRIPAEHLTRLLIDNESRVYRYTYNLFDQRHIEPELVNSLLQVIQKNKEIKSWHLINIVKLLGKRSLFYSKDVAQIYGKQIVETLKPLCNYFQSTTRLEVYRALLEYKEFIDYQSMLDDVKKDGDQYIQALAKKIEN